MNILNKVTLKNSIAIVLVFIGFTLIILFINGINNTDSMGGAMTLIAISEISIMAVILGIVFLFLGEKWFNYPLHWGYRLLCFVSSFFIFKNIYLYTNVSHEAILHNDGVMYPSWEQDVFGLFIVGIFLLKSFRRNKNVFLEDSV